MVSLSGFQIKFPPRLSEEMMFLAASPAASTWDLESQLCSLGLVCRPRNEHTTWLTTVLMDREPEYHLAGLRCEGFSVCLSEKNKEKGMSFPHPFALLRMLVYLGEGLGKYWKTHGAWNYSAEKFCDEGDTRVLHAIHSLSSDSNWGAAQLTEEQPTLSLLWHSFHEQGDS